MKRARKLTPAEEKRGAAFDKTCEELERQGYVKREMTVGALAANLFGLLSSLPFVGIGYWIYRMFCPPLDFLHLELLWFLIFTLILVVVHELIHGLMFGMFADGHFRSVRFGIIWSGLMPYCTCSEPLKRWQYVLACLTPTLVLGFGLMGAAAILHSSMLFLIGGVMTVGGGGDLFMILKILFYPAGGKEALFHDHPWKCGFVAFERAG